tara:strand:- start:29 stop:502 length:474 start_codon:yes stop_codon:yes gene_type:complete
LGPLSSRQRSFEKRHRRAPSIGAIEGATKGGLLGGLKKGPKLSVKPPKIGPNPNTKKIPGALRVQKGSFEKNFPGDFSAQKQLTRRKTMAKLSFSDGVEIDTSTREYHLQRRQDGWYVVGKGTLCPVTSIVEGRQVIRELEELEALRNMRNKNTGSD